MAKGKNIKQREQIKPSFLNQVQYGVQRSEDDEEDHDVLQPNTKFASLKEQSLFYGDIPVDNSINYYDVEVGQGSPEELADAIEGLVTGAEKEGMSRDGVQSL
jgi:hypothetical protein